MSKNDPFDHPKITDDDIERELENLKSSFSNKENDVSPV